MGYNSNNNKETMFDNQLKPLYDGRVLVNESAMNNPVIQAVLRDMSNRNFQPLPTPNEGKWYISDRH